MKLSIYTSDSCQYCKMAKTLIKANGHTYEEFNVSNDHLAKSFFDSKGYRGVPVIYLDRKKFAVGYPELVRKIGEI